MFSPNLCFSFNKFDFPPIFHRDGDINPDEIRVSGTLSSKCHSSLQASPFIILIYFTLCSEIVEDLLSLEKIQDRSQRRKGCSLITHMLTRYKYCYYELALYNVGFVNLRDISSSSSFLFAVVAVTCS